MKKLLFIGLFVLFIGSSVGYSQDITWTPIPIPGSYQSDGYNPYKQNQPKQESGYTSNTGTQYQYDLNNPADRVKYNADPAAQRRDRLNTNPKVKIDQSVGQHGGGVEQD